MKEWEKRDIVDVLRDHHADLGKAAVELGEGGDHEGSVKIDNDIIVVEQFLESEHGIKWDGTQFLEHHPEPSF